MKLLKLIFGEKKEPAKINSISMDEYKFSRDAEQLRQKNEWIKQNELQKKKDSCYLGTRNKAFYGTYEEYISKTELFGQHAGLAAMSRISAQQQAAYLNSSSGYFGRLQMYPNNSIFWR